MLIRWFIAGISLLAVVALVMAQNPLRPIEDMRMPLEHYEDGKIKVQLTAGIAKVPPKGVIEAEKVRVEFYDEDGRTNGFMTAETCRYDRVAGVVSSDSAVKFEKSDAVITGVGMHCVITQEVVEILSEVKVVMSQNLKLKRKAE